MFIPFGDNGIEASLNQEILGEISFAGAKKRFLSDKPAGWQVCRNRNDNIDYFQMVASISRLHYITAGQAFQGGSLPLLEVLLYHLKIISKY
jgi:hypothetical protein